jgi:hypothetical protein
MDDSSETRDEESSETTNKGSGSRIKSSGSTLTPNPDTRAKKFNYAAAHNNPYMVNGLNYTTGAQSGSKG